MQYILRPFSPICSIASILSAVVHSVLGTNKVGWLFVSANSFKLQLAAYNQCKKSILYTLVDVANEGYPQIPQAYTKVETNYVVQEQESTRTGEKWSRLNATKQFHQRLRSIPLRSLESVLNEDRGCHTEEQRQSVTNWSLLQKAWTWKAQSPCHPSRQGGRRPAVHPYVWPALSE